METEALGVQDYLQLYNELEAGLGYMRPCKKEGMEGMKEGRVMFAKC